MLTSFISSRLATGSSCVALSLALAVAQGAAPRILYSDLDSAPSAGGENGGGAYVTIYGTNFGDAQGSSIVKIGTMPATNYQLWTNTKVAFQIPTSVPAGSQSLTITLNGLSSNAIPFTVRTSGKIYCVALSGSDGYPGTFAGGCWRTVQHAVDVMQPGDTLYARQGVLEAGASTEGSISIGKNRYSIGTPGNPIAIVGYPGETAQIGGIGPGPCNSTCVEGLVTYNVDRAYSNFVVANLVLRGNNSALAISGDSQHMPSSQNWRIIGNDISCPYGDGAAGCVETSRTNNVVFYGNNVHDVGRTGATTLYHAVYFSTDSNHIDVGWNSITRVNGCYGIQFHSSPLYGGVPSDPTGHQQYDLSVHHNTISDTQCSGIMFATVDPSQGKVEAFNNVIFNAGRGPFNGASYFCVDFPGYANQPPAGGGTAEVYSNTLYNCGSATASAGLDPGWGGAINNFGPANGQPALQVRIRNNIVYQPTPGQYYWSIFDSVGDISDTSNVIFGTNNVFYGLASRGPSNELNNPNVVRTIQQNPMLMNVVAPDLHLLPVSPAIGNGQVVPTVEDHDGIPVPTAAGYSIGAYAYTGFKSSDTPITITPSSVTLKGGQLQQFVANSSQVTWSISPLIGTVSSTGLYTAPAVIASAGQCLITATSTSNPANQATATITLSPNPPVISFTVSPANVTLQAGQSQTFSVTGTDQAVRSVTWSINPPIGTVSAQGLYTAPARTTAQQDVVLTATSPVDRTKSANATITLAPPTVLPGPGLFWTMLPDATGPARIELRWTAPATRSPYDSIVLASVDAPDWWSVWQLDTNGAGSGTQTLSVTLAGRYEFRYRYAATSTKGTIALRSTPFDVGLTGFQVTTSALNVPTGGSITFSWTAGPTRSAADFVALYPIGRTSDRPIASSVTYTQGATSGSATIRVPSTAGSYEVRYVFSDSMRTAARTQTINVN
jgi:hypothetical protein